MQFFTSSNRVIDTDDSCAEYKRRLSRKLQYNLHEVSAIMQAFDVKKCLFFTLTYDPAHYSTEEMSPGSDFREFMNVLKNTYPEQFRGMSYFWAVEEGKENNRLHVHFCCNSDYINHEDCKRLWGRGQVWFSPIVPKWYKNNAGVWELRSCVGQVASYISKYVSKTIETKTGEPFGVDLKADDYAVGVDYTCESWKGRKSGTSADFEPVPEKNDAFPVEFILRDVLQAFNAYEEKGYFDSRDNYCVQRFIDEDDIETLKALNEPESVIALAKGLYGEYMHQRWEDSRLQVRRGCERFISQLSFNTTQDEIYELCLEKFDFSPLQARCLRGVVRTVCREMTVVRRWCEKRVVNTIDENANGSAPMGFSPSFQMDWRNVSNEPPVWLPKPVEKFDEKLLGIWKFEHQVSYDLYVVQSERIIEQKFEFKDELETTLYSRVLRFE